MNRIFVFMGQTGNEAKYLEALGPEARVHFFLPDTAGARPVEADLVIVEEKFFCDHETALEVALQESLAVPVLFVTENLGCLDVANALARPLIDFARTPLNAQEIRFRLSKLLPRGSSAGKFDLVLNPGDLTISRKRSEPVALTFKEYRIFTELLSSPGATLSRHDLASRIWRSWKTIPRSLDVHLCNIRKKIEPLGLGLRSDSSGRLRISEYTGEINQNSGV
jgi:hypothetical protein